MKITFKLRGKPVVMSQLEDAIALRPSDEVRSAETKVMMMRRFGAASALDDTVVGSVGLSVSGSDRKIFENSGWLFVEPQERLERAAATRSSVTDADAVRHVFVTPAGSTMIQTELVTLQFVRDVTDTEVGQLLLQRHLKLVRRLPFAANLFEARLTAGRPFAESIGQLQADPELLFAEPAMLQAITGRWTPTDPDFPQQWQHKNDGGNGGKVDADIKSEGAWNDNRGLGVRIAVIDNGMQVKHPDLKAAIRTGARYKSDGQGGATWIRHAPGTAGFPSGDHGTFCMGMAGARANNHRGGCGSAPESELLPIACLTDQIGSQVTLARAISFAANPRTEDPAAAATDGAHIIACSLGPSGAGAWQMTSVLELAIRNAAQTGRNGLGVPIFWAVSNGYHDIAEDEVCSHPDVIAVGRSNRNDLDDGSAHGPKLEFLAPGRDVFSTKQGGGYDISTGTSFACPLAAGVGALVLAKYSAWTRDQVRQRLRDCCDKIGGVPYNANGKLDDFGYGRINAERAVQ